MSVAARDFPTLVGSIMPLLAPFLLIFIPLTAIVLLVGLLPLQKRAPNAAIAVELGSHAASWVIVLAYAAFWIPPARKIFQDFGVELSGLSLLLIQMAALMAQPLVMLIVAAIVLAADWIIYSSLWGNEASQTVRNRFSLFMTLVPLSMMMVLGTAIYLSLTKLVLG
jgi:hypothetical protein